MSPVLISKPQPGYKISIPSWILKLQPNAPNFGVAGWSGCQRRKRCPLPLDTLHWGSWADIRADKTEQIRRRKAMSVDRSPTPWDGERNYLYWHPGTSWFSEAPSPSIIVWKQQAPGRNEKVKKQISTTDIKNFEAMWKGDHHNSVTATEPEGWGDCGMYTRAVISPLAVYLQCQREENSKGCVPHTTESSDWPWQIHPSRSGRKVVETSAKVPRTTQVGQTWNLCKSEQLRLLGWTSVVL